MLAIKLHYLSEFAGKGDNACGRVILLQEQWAIVTDLFLAVFDRLQNCYGTGSPMIFAGFLAAVSNGQNWYRYRERLRK